PAPAVAIDPEERLLDEAELESAMARSTRLPEGSVPGQPSPFACPDCHGVLMEVPDPAVLRFRCRTGHAWSADSLDSEQDSAVEEALWSAVRALEERHDVSRRLAERAENGQQVRSAAYYRRRADESLRAASTLRGHLRQTAEAAVLPAAEA
ncbi:MAG: chemotaxis protein CheB, partial [Frankiales bacterium]|nr:chemotaxis protein CheB [Frankiales bacterium]